MTNLILEESFVSETDVKFLRGETGHFNSMVLLPGISYNGLKLGACGIVDPVCAALRAHSSWDIAHNNNTKPKLNSKSGFTGFFSSPTNRAFIWLLIIHLSSSS